LEIKVLAIFIFRALTEKEVELKQHKFGNVIIPQRRLSLRKWVPRISAGLKTAGAFGWRPTTLVMPNVTKIRGLNLHATPWAASACCGMTLLSRSTCLWNTQPLYQGLKLQNRKTNEANTALLR